MKIHEYQAKAILARYGVPIPRGEVAYRKEEVRRLAEGSSGANDQHGAYRAVARSAGFHYH